MEKIPRVLIAHQAHRLFFIQKNPFSIPMQDFKRFQKTVRFLLIGTRGGFMRGRIMQELFLAPLNPNQLAQKLGVDYKTIQHHLGVLLKNNWVVRKSESYGEAFFPAFSREEKTLFESVWAQIGKKV